MLIRGPALNATGGGCTCVSGDVSVWQSNTYSFSFVTFIRHDNECDICKVPQLSWDCDKVWKSCVPEQDLNPHTYYQEGSLLWLLQQNTNLADLAMVSQSNIRKRTFKNLRNEHIKKKKRLWLNNRRLPNSGPVWHLWHFHTIFPLWHKIAEFMMWHSSRMV